MDAAGTAKAARPEPVGGVQLNRVEVSYRDAYLSGEPALTASGLTHAQVVWSGKTETVFRADGDVWSRTVDVGPGLDVVLVDRGDLLPRTPGQLVVAYPTRLAEPFTVRTTGPGMVLPGPAD
jgi:hypothetical protein